MSEETTNPRMLVDLPVISPADRDVQDEFALKGMKAWRSVDDLKQSEEFKTLNAGEFAPDAMKEPTSGNRRDFMKILGATAAMTGLTACRRPVKNILPYTRKPEEVIPGKPLLYATAMPFEGVLRPVLVESHDGRPTKIEGNPEHPVSLGSSGIYEQASILNLYDPDRSKTVLSDGRASTWNEFAAFVSELPETTRILVIDSPSSSPTEAALKSAVMTRFSAVDWVTYSPAGGHNREAGSRLAFGQPYRQSFRFQDAAVIVSLDGDFLGSDDPNEVPNARGYSESRRVTSTDDTMSRLYVAEGAFSITGGMADHRLTVKPSQIAGLAAAIGVGLGLTTASGSVSVREQKWVDALVGDLKASRGSSIVLAGRDQPASVHAACALINAALDNIDRTVILLDTGDQVVPTSDLSGAVSKMNDGAYDAVVCLGVNPVYSAPGALNFSAALSSVQTRIHLGSHVDETAALCNWHVPETHYLEYWGDGRAFDGTLSVIQPLIAPLYADAKSRIELLNALAGGKSKTGYELVTETWQSVMPGDFAKGWRKVVHDGLWSGSAYMGVAAIPTAGFDSLSGMLDSAAGAIDGLEVVIRPDRGVYDGLYSNNAWMQELPDSVHKITWDNYAAVSPETAAELGVNVVLSKGQHLADVVSVSVGSNIIQLPLWISPGQADGTVSLTMGYGRQIASDRPPTAGPFFDLDVDVYSDGAMANGIGANAAALLSADGSRIVAGGSVSATGVEYMLASTQDHPSMEGRPIVRMATIDEFRAHPTFADDEVPGLKGLEPWDEYPELWSDHPKNREEFTRSPYHKNQWAMAVDLNACTGCNACVIACQSENSIQVVGKESVAVGREMAWMRLDRYFTGDSVSDAGMVMQPMMCAHCENAPCEQVCPVAATTHSGDGLNVMVYNRCIGTRYCANNCPYKVRRFNYFNWSKTLPKQVQMGQNPNVTVRFRGVMEKCTYCIQRIRAVGITARQDGDRDIADGEVVTACQQACPSQAIAFGSITDSDSEIVRQKSDPRSYELLAELAIKPRTSYLARLRNPNPALEEESAS